MKTILTIIVTILIAGVAGYLLGPMLIERELSPLRTEIAQLQERIQASEGFIRSEEEARKRTGLKADTGLPEVVSAVNRLVTQQKGFEDAVNARFEGLDARLAEMKAANQEGISRLSQAMEEGTKNANRRFQANAFRQMVEGAKVRLVKVKSELLAKNIGAAKGELNLLIQTLDDAKKQADDNGGRKARIEKLQGMTKEIKTEMDENLLAATDRIDLLWHELAKLPDAE